MTTKQKTLICVLIILFNMHPGGCKREIPADKPVDNAAAIARAERAERELAKTRETLQQLRQDKELEASIGANTSDQIKQLNAQLDEVLKMQEQLVQAVKTAEAERDQARAETKEAHELANELEKYLQDSEKRVSALEKANQELEALVDDLSAQVTILSEASNEVDGQEVH